MPPRHWQASGTVSKLLRPLSWVYGRMLAWRQLLYKLRILRPKRLPVPVLVVGNVLAGGVGKTPIVIALVKHLQLRGLEVGIVSRGYGRKDKALQEVHRHSEVSKVGDEPLLLSHATGAPVFVAKNRVLACLSLLRAHPQTQLIVSDDGLQHWAMGRDVEIVVFDERGVGNGQLLPAGPLREPYPRLGPQSRMQFVLDKVPRALADFAINARGERQSLKSLAAKTVHAVSAIAKPEQFFDMLCAQGLSLKTTKAYPDHDPLQSYTLPTNAAHEVLCTAKDAVKLWHRNPDVWAVPLGVQLDPHFLKALDACVDALLAAKKPVLAGPHHGH